MFGLTIASGVAVFTSLCSLALGIYNLFHMRRAEKVRLRVAPQASSFYGTDTLTGREVYLHNEDHYPLEGLRAADTLSVQIVNLSKFAVTVGNVGLLRKGSRNRLAVINPIMRDGGEWPRKLEPRDVVTVHFDATKLLELEGIGRVTKAYAKTVCGTQQCGTSGALKEFVRIARAA